MVLLILATSTPICEPWSTWSECAGEKCKDKTKTRRRTCPNGLDTEEEPCFVEDDCKPGMLKNNIILNFFIS